MEKKIKGSDAALGRDRAGADWFGALHARPLPAIQPAAPCRDTPFSPILLASSGLRRPFSNRE